MGAASRIGLAGFVATAVAYGPARTGYGLFLPDFRREFGLSTELAGVIASGLQVGYLLALSATALLVARLGPRLLVAAGGASAVFGMLLVALSPGTAALAAAVVLSGMSAGFSWSPYNDAAEAAVPARLRGRVLSVVSTGTTFGIAASGLVALAVAAGGLPWRVAWLTFVAGGVASALLNARLLPGGRPRAGSAAPAGRPGVGRLLRGGSVPLFVVALSFGVVNAFYWSFAADLISSAGGSLPDAGSVLYVVLGAAGFAGLFTGDLVDRFGLGRILRATLLCLGVGAGLLGAAPGTLPLVGISAMLYGAGVMLMSALLAVWSSAVFREQPSAGFTAALLLFGFGGVVGPAVLGAFGGRFGLGAAFLLAAALALLTMAVRPAAAERSTANV